MTESASQTCPSCGAAASGNFCASCGAALGHPACRSCGAELGPGARFCHKCGSPTSGSPLASSPLASGARSVDPTTPVTPSERPKDANRGAWIIAAVLVVAIIAGVIYSAKKRAAPAAPSMANAGNSAGDAGDPGVIRAPNIDSMSPKERFIRLQTRIDQQLQQRDTARVGFFMQMAMQAYGMIPESDRDIDVRFHAAMLQAEADLLPGARALADTIMKQSPDNLLGYYIRATVAEFAGDSAQARSARAAFRAHFDAEMAKNRPEYAEHRPFLEQYLKGAGAK